MVAPFMYLARISSVTLQSDYFRYVLRKSYRQAIIVSFELDNADEAFELRHVALSLLAERTHEADQMTE